MGIDVSIKQQSDIRAFLINEYGKHDGTLYFEEQRLELNDLLRKTKGKSKNQYKTLMNTILPRIALYNVLKKVQRDVKSALDVERGYMINVVGEKKHAATARIERFPGFFHIYRSVYLKIMRTTDLQKSTQESGKGYYDITITNCLWHNACVEHGCPELCELFCDVDDVHYGGLRKIGFSRTKTLGYGGDCCDFHFYKK
jgi:hypothetical protein